MNEWFAICGRCIVRLILPEIHRWSFEIVESIWCCQTFSVQYMSYFLVECYMLTLQSWRWIFYWPKCPTHQENTHRFLHTYQRTNGRYIYCFLLSIINFLTNKVILIARLVWYLSNSSLSCVPVLPMMTMTSRSNIMYVKFFSNVFKQTKDDIVETKIEHFNFFYYLNHVCLGFYIYITW